MNDNAVCFFDTSALIKYYHDELGRQKVVDLVDNPNNRIFISRLGLIEWHSAFFRLMRMNAFTHDEFQTIRTRFLSDIRQRKFLIQPFERTHQNQAIRLLARYASTESLRTLDALQLAIALHVNSHTPLDYFVCADSPFCQTAALAGLSVLNPELNEAPLE